MTVPDAVRGAQLPWQPCERCGSLGVDAEPNGEVVTFACPACGHLEERVRPAFFSVTGASGSGKSTIVRRLWRDLPECVVLDGDVLWNERFWNEPDAFYALWLNVVAQISQSTHHPVVLCTAAMPQAWDEVPQRVLASTVHMLALVCDEDEMLRRLEARRRPKGAAAPADCLDHTRTFNRWLRANVEHLDTSVLGPDEAAAQVADWVRARL